MNFNNYVLASMLWMLSSTTIPVVMLSFPEHALNSNCSYAKLRPLLALYMGCRASELRRNVRSCRTPISCNSFVPGSESEALLTDFSVLL